MTDDIRALVIDVFGTVVDWRGSIIREGADWAAETGVQVDWGSFADSWRAKYVPSMQRVRSGELSWTRLDDLNRMALEDVLREFGIRGLTDETRNHWNRVWHRFSPWADSAEGLERLRDRFVVASLSNGNVSMLVDMAKMGGFCWDAVLSAELFRHYKPDEEVYLGAAELLGCRPNELMMVAAHTGDLRAARGCGLRTAFISRPYEYGPSKPPERPGQGEFDRMASDLIDLAHQLD